MSYKTRYGQSILDIMLQNKGSISGLTEFYKDIDSVNDTIIDGRDVSINKESNQITKYYDSKSLVVSASKEIEPEPVTVFQFTVQSDNAGTSNNDQFTFPQRSGTSPNYTISSPDSSATPVVVTSDTNPTTITFPEGAGTYTVEIDGDDIQPHFNNGGDKDKITNINFYGDCIIGEASFWGCDNIGEIFDVSIPVLSSNISNAFRNADTLQLPENVNNWNMSIVTQADGLFANTIFNRNINNWDVSGISTFTLFFERSTFNSLIFQISTNATSLFRMFEFAILFNQDLSFWNVSNVTEFRRVLNGASSFNQNLGNWNLSSANNINNMLSNCGMSTENYNKTLHGWVNGGWTIPTGLTLGANNLIADAGNGGSIPNGLAAKNTLEITYGWTIIDNTP